MTSNYYVKSGTTYYSFNDIFIRESAANTVTNFYDNNTNLTANYRNIIATDNLQIKHTSVNFIYGSIDISQYLLPKFYEFTSASTGSFTVPPWCTTIKAIIIGGGGRGGNYYYRVNSDNDGYDKTDGGGGGGGGYCYISVSIVSNVTTIYYTVGSRGSFDSGTSGDGGFSQIMYNSISYKGNGGNKGGDGDVNNDGNGGSGGTRDPTQGTLGNNGTDGNAGSPLPTGGDGGIGGFNTTHEGIQTNSYGNGGNGGYNQDNGRVNPTQGSIGYVRIYFIR